MLPPDHSFTVPVNCLPSLSSSDWLELEASRVRSVQRGKISAHRLISSSRTSFFLCLSSAPAAACPPPARSVGLKKPAAFGCRTVAVRQPTDGLAPPFLSLSHSVCNNANLIHLALPLARSLALACSSSPSVPPSPFPASSSLHRRSGL